VLPLVLSSALFLAGCAATAERLPGAGLAQETPLHSGPLSWLAVHDMPPPRPEAVLTPDEQESAMAGLIAARAGQMRSVAAAARVEAERDEADRKAAEPRKSRDAARESAEAVAR
jgi:hypothetical protein